MVGFDLAVGVVLMILLIQFIAFHFKGGWMAVDAVYEEVLTHDKMTVFEDGFSGEAVVFEHEVTGDVAVVCTFAG